MTARSVLSYLFMLVLSISAFANDGKLFSYGPDGKNYFTKADDKILVRFVDGLSFQEKSNILADQFNLKIEAEDVLPAPDVAIVKITGMDNAGVQQLLMRLNNSNSIVYANPFLIYEDGTYQGIQDRIIVRLKSDKDASAMYKIAKGLNLNVLERNEFDPLIYVLQTTKLSNGNAMQMANTLAESAVFEYAEPDFLLLLKKFSTNDPLLDYQWALNNTGSSLQYSGTAGADMHVFNAWGITTGSSSIKVAVIDEGVDLNHPDLQANLLGGYDATGQGSGGGPSGDDAHGTNCAGIIAAVGNNNLGTAGVAYGCKIIPVRIAYGNAQGNWVTSNTWIGNAINWAWQTGNADILSNSWGGGSSSSTINNAITGAVTNGRGGLGSPVLFAAGNDNGANSYPATVTNTISVIAMSMCYERKNPNSCDGETWWGSNYGTGADVAAPGVKIAATDISGSAGYASGDYYLTFNGTSSATPNTSGVMALILSANPNLTFTQARYALESTCRKVGSYTYNSNVSGQPNGTWSNDLGYGLVDAYAAVLSVSPQVADDAGISSISSPSGTICATSATPQLTLSNFGLNTLSSVTINYQLDAGSVQTYSWTGSLASTASTTVSLPSISFAGGTHTFNVWTSDPNGNSDNGPSNDDASSSFASASNGVTLTIVLDNYPEETSWQILNGTTILAAGGTYGSQSDGSTVVENVCLPDGCFDLVMNDTYGDGICCGYGSGSYVLRDDSDNSVLASGGNFGSSETTNFCVQSTPALAALISSSVSVSCNGGSNGSATASASGGTAPYSYSWSNGATGATASGLVAGTYTVTVTDGNSNQATATVTISEPTVLTYVPGQTDVTCNGENNGSAYVLVSGGTSPYSYSWSNGQTNFTAIDLVAGSTSVTVTDANGCTISASFTITEPTALQASSSSSDVSCSGYSDGTISVSVNGGTIPYIYSWSNGSTTASQNGLSVGTYSVMVTDSNGCVATDSATVGEPSPISLNITTVDASCEVATNGSIDLSVSGGTSPYGYVWSNGASTQDLNGVPSGSYAVTITDVNGCTIDSSATVSLSSTLSSTASASDVSCNGGNDGSVSVSVSGGTSPYSYAWNNGATAASQIDLVSGLYNVTITDSVGCTTLASTSVLEPAALSLAITGNDISCFGANDGDATASVSGGTLPYTYLWSNGSTSNSISGLVAGTYDATVTDNNGCTVSESISIAEPTALSASTSATDVSCNGATDGSIDLSVSGGTSPYTYDWSNGAASEDLTAVGAGNYTVTITDANGCSSNETTLVDQPPGLSVSTSISEVTCYGGNNGEATGSASGGTPPYTYSWSTGSSTNSATGLNAGSYTLTVTDTNGCTASTSASINQPDTLNVSLSGVDASCETADGSGTASVSGGTPPYSYIWSNGSTSSSASNLIAGTYSVTVSDANGCSSVSSITIDEDCGSCTFVTVDSNDFESGWGIWNDGGSDCSLISNSSYASSGYYSIQLRDNTPSSVATTYSIDLSDASEITIAFSYMTNSMESGESFWLQISTDGGISFTTIGDWTKGVQFQNNQRYNETVVYSGTFTSNSRIRFRCDASGNSDWVYIDDVTISACKQSPVSPTCTDGIQNGDEEGIDCGGSFCTPCVSNCVYETIDSNDLESGWGIWTDGGVDCNRSTDAAHAYSGTRAIRLRDDSGVRSSTTTNDLDLTGYDEVTIDFTFITSGMIDGQDFWLQYATSNSYSTAATYVTGGSYSNETFYTESVVISGPFSANTSFRFRCDAATNSNQVFLDDIVISGCRNGAEARLANPIIAEEAKLIDQTLSDVNLYPNPTSDILNVSMELSQAAKVEMMILDATGKTVLVRTLNQNEGTNKFSFNMYDLPSGLYLMNVISGKERITKRFIIQR